MRPSQTPPHLYHFRVAHYSEKARWALDRKRVPHRRTALVPGFHAPRAFLLSRQIGLPVLVLDGETIPDSTRIIARLEALHPDPPLYPADPAARARALAIEEHYDEVVAPEVRRIFWSTYFDDPAATARMATTGAGSLARTAFRAALPLFRPVFRRDMDLGREEVARATASLPGHFDRLAREVGPSGFHVGDAFSVADLTAAAVMTAIVRPRGFPYPLPEPLPPAFASLRARFTDHPAFRWVEETYARHRDPSTEVP